MTAQLFNVTYLKTASPYQVGETAARPLDQAARLIAAGIARVADDAPAREEGIRSANAGYSFSSSSSALASFRSAVSKPPVNRP
jgi:hypothetical protein